MSATVTLKQHFARLFDWTGREDRASFWPYAAVAFAITMVAGMVIFIPMMSRSLHAMQDFAAQHPEQATVTSGPGQYSIAIHGNQPSFFPANSMFLYLVVTFGLAIFLYASAVVRRLHDRGKSGFWGLIPLPFIVFSSVQMPRMFASVSAGAQPDMTVFFSIFLSNLLYITALIWLIVLLAGQSDPRANRFNTTA
jgi:uncharacterized membrane protein YhaH (DUF805 family)